MSIMDSIARTILQVRVDGITEAKAQLSSLSAHEKKIADDRIKGLEAGNAGLSKWVGALGQVGVALGVVKVGMEAFEFHAHKMDLQSAAAGVSIEKLRKASMGLKTDMELLEHAAKFNTGSFKLTQTQMEQTERAMFMLEEQGKSSQQVWAAMETAITKGSTKPLLELGIAVQDTDKILDSSGEKLDEYSRRQKAHALVLKEVAALAEQGKDAQLDQVDAMQASMVTLKNYWDDAKNKLGELVVQLGPLIAQLGQAVGQVAQLAALVPKDIMGGGGNAFSGSSVGPLGHAASWMTDQFNKGGINTSNDSLSGRENNRRMARLAFGTQWNAFQKGISEGYQAPDAWSGGSTGLDPSKFFTTFNRFIDAVDKYNKKEPLDLGDYWSRVNAANKPGYDGRIGASALGSNAMPDGIDLSALASEQEQARRDEITERNAALTEDWLRRIAEQQNKVPNLLEQLGINDPSAMDAAIAAVQGFSSGYTQALQAIGSGTLTAGEAFKKGLGIMVGALGDKLAAFSAAEFVTAGAHAITLDFAGAAMHAGAGALYGAGAIAAYAASAKLGGKGGSAPAGAGATSGAGAGASGGRASSGGGAGAGGGTTRQPVTNIFVVGSQYDHLSTRERRQEAEKTVKLAGLSAGGTDS
jgi:hypothetical protein